MDIQEYQSSFFNIKYFMFTAFFGVNYRNTHQFNLFNQIKSNFILFV